MLTSLPSKATPFINVQDGITLAHAIVDTVRDPSGASIRICASLPQAVLLPNLSARPRRCPAAACSTKIDGGQWNIPELRELLETIANGSALSRDMKSTASFP